MIIFDASLGNQRGIFGSNLDHTVLEITKNKGFLRLPYFAFISEKRGMKRNIFDNDRNELGLLENIYQVCYFGG